MPKAIRRSVHLPPTRKQHRLTNAIEASFSRQVRLRQIGGCPTQHFVLLLQQLDAPTQSAVLGQLTIAQRRLFTFFDPGV